MIKKHFNLIVKIFAILNLIVLFFLPSIIKKLIDYFNSTIQPNGMLITMLLYPYIVGILAIVIGVLLISAKEYSKKN